MSLNSQPHLNPETSLLSVQDMGVGVFLNLFLNPFYALGY